WQGRGAARIIRKGLEFVYTQLIEWIWGKQRILEVYLNVIETGKGVYGIQAAAQYYYKKDASALTSREAASIIACLPNPKKYTVIPQSSFVRFKTGWILGQMHNLRGDGPIEAIIKRSH